MPGLKGEQMPLAKLTDEDVSSIRRSYAGGTATMIALAKQYGVHPLIVFLAATGRTWGHVPGAIPWREGDRRPRPRGQDRPSAKLTDEDVRAIRRDYAAGVASQPVLARKYGINNATVCRIVNRKIWAHLSDDPPDVPIASGFTRLTPDDIRAIRRAYDTRALNQTQLAKQYGVDTSSVTRIVRRETYRHIADECEASA